LTGEQAGESSDEPADELLSELEDEPAVELAGESAGELQATWEVPVHCLVARPAAGRGASLVQDKISRREFGFRLTFRRHDSRRLLHG